MKIVMVSLTFCLKWNFLCANVKVEKGILVFYSMFGEKYEKNKFAL